MDVVGSPGESGGARTDEIAPADAVSGAADVRLVRPSPDSGGGVVPVAATESAGGTPDYQSDRIVAIPLPREGELYVRYGPADRTIPAAPSAGPIVPSPTATAQERPPPALDAEGLQALIRSEVARATRDTTTITRTDLSSLEERLLAVMRSQPAPVDEARPPPGGAADSAIAAISQQVQELARIVREGIVQSASQPVTLSVLPTSTMPVPELVSRRAPFFRHIDAHAGTSTIRDSRTGVGAGVDMTLGAFGGERWRPYLGLGLGWTSVRTTFSGSSVIGSVSRVALGGGLEADLPALGPVAPLISLGLVGVGGGTEGETEQDADLMERLYGDFVMGPSFGIGGAWRGRRGPAGTDLTARLTRTWAGARGGWGFELGLRYRRRISQSAQPTALRIPSVGEVRDEVGVPAAAGTLAQQPADDSAQAAPSPAEAELLGRLQELEASLAQERTEREAAEAAARTEAASQRARADSLAARTNAVDQAERARRAAEMDRDRIRSELDLLVSTLEDVTTLRSTNRGLEIVIGGALFPTGSSSLTARGRAEVESIAAALRGARMAGLLIDGHTDSTGSEETNRTVSLRRAEAVRAVLVGAGLDPTSITVLASGEGSPIADNATPDGRARNRRVEIVIR